MNDFDVVIVDEVHERHLVVDFVLGILREACWETAVLGHNGKVQEVSKSMHADGL